MGLSFTNRAAAGIILSVAIAGCGSDAVTSPSELALRDSITSYVERAAAADSFSGTVLVAKGSTIITAHAAGMADRSTGRANTMETPYNLGSLGKSFTAVAVAQLVERGVLRFTDTVGKILPTYPNAAVAQKVTIAELLNHSSGLPLLAPEAIPATQRAGLRTVTDWASLVVNMSPQFEPGTQTRYSNAGYILLGLIIEHLTGQTYYDYVRDHIALPAEMSATGFPARAELGPVAAVGYVQPAGSGAHVPNDMLLPYRGASAGGGYGSAPDLLRFAAALTRGRLLSTAYADTIMRNSFGFYKERPGLQRIAGNEGGGQGVSTFLRIYLDTGYVVVVLSNDDPPAARAVGEYIDQLLQRQSGG